MRLVIAKTTTSLMQTTWCKNSHLINSKLPTVQV
jgi:hypothetical protein